MSTGCTRKFAYIYPDGNSLAGIGNHRQTSTNIDTRRQPSTTSDNHRNAGVHRARGVHSGIGGVYQHLLPEGPSTVLQNYRSFTERYIVSYLVKSGII